jgi:SAM-dependent methyltransferase
MALYDDIGKRYRNHRHPDPRIAAALLREIADARTILNVGAGTGAYEPTNRHVVAVDPSRTMIVQRRRALSVQARAEALPFAAKTFDCAMAVLTVHHWTDVGRGMAEMLRVARRRIVLLTRIGFGAPFWLVDYLPQIKVVDETVFPSMAQLTSWLGPIRTIPVPIAHDCTDGFLCAYWRRPEAYLDEGVRRGISTFARLTCVDEGLARLRHDLASGRWHERYAGLLSRDEMDFGYRVAVAGIDARSAQCEQ